MIKIKLYILFILSFAIYACNGQKSKTEVQPVTSEKDSLNVQSNKNSSDNFSLFPDSNDQIDQVVRTIYQDSKRNIWFGAEGGVFKFNGDLLTQINTIKSESGKSVTIKDITESKDGTLWFAHTDGISSVKGELVTNYYESDGLISNDAWCITPASNGNIWIGTVKGISVFDGQKFTDFKLPEGTIDSTVGISSTTMIHSIQEDSKGTLWLSTNAGLFSYSNNELVNISEKVGIQTNFVNEIFEDKKGTFWISTKKGLYHLNGHKINNITEGKIEDGKGIGSIAEDKNGKIWFVSNQHFLYTYDGGQLIEYEKTENNKGPVIFKIYKDLDDRLWFVGFGGAYRLENGTFVNITQNGPW